MKKAIVLIFLFTALLGYSQQPFIIPIDSDLNFYMSDTLSSKDAKKISKLAYVYCNERKPIVGTVVRFQVFNKELDKAVICTGEYMTDSARMLIVPGTIPYTLYIEGIIGAIGKDTIQLTYKKIVIKD